MNDTIIYATAQSEPLPVDIEYSWRTARRRHKACMGWSWAAAYGVQGRGILRDFRAQLVLNNLPRIITCRSNGQKTKLQ